VNESLDASYAHCRMIARQAAKNFYYAFLLLPSEKRRSMFALYAFLRRADDLSDSSQPVETRRAALSAWRKSLEAALEGHADDPILPALADTVARWRIAPNHLLDVLDGVEMDLHTTRYETFDELLVYCRRVASAVGLACLSIWGYDPHAPQTAAVDCGVAFQLTNILRDLKEDAERGRVYLPLEDLRRFDYSVDDLRQGVVDDRFHTLVNFEITRARDYYDRGQAVCRWVDHDARAVCTTMIGTYRALLEEVDRRQDDLLSQRVRISRWRKLWIAGRAWWHPSIDVALLAGVSAP